jgi:hypothetical protein
MDLETSLARVVELSLCPLGTCGTTVVEGSLASLPVAVLEALICVSPDDDKVDTPDKGLLVVFSSIGLLIYCNRHTGRACS